MEEYIYISGSRTDQHLYGVDLVVLIQAEKWWEDGDTQLSCFQGEVRSVPSGRHGHFLVPPFPLCPTKYTHAGHGVVVSCN